MSAIDFGDFSYDELYRMAEDAADGVGEFTVDEVVEIINDHYSEELIDTPSYVELMRCFSDVFGDKLKDMIQTQAGNNGQEGELAKLKI